MRRPLSEYAKGGALASQVILMVMLALQRSSLAFNLASVGKRCTVMVERKGKLSGQWLGKSPWLQSVHFEGAAGLGDLVEVELTQGGPNSLHAVMV